MKKKRKNRAGGQQRPRQTPQASPDAALQAQAPEAPRWVLRLLLGAAGR